MPPGFFTIQPTRFLPNKSPTSGRIAMEQKLVFLAVLLALIVILRQPKRGD
jgi:hypothetical protein